MHIREYKPEDLEAIKKMHGKDYVMPSPDHPLMIVKKVMADEDDVARQAIFGRLFISALLYVDHEWKTPQERLDALICLQKEAMDAGRSAGLDIALTQMEGRFAQRMQQLGWVRGWGEVFLHVL
jgi:hypothetical protein